MVFVLPDSHETNMDCSGSILDRICRGYIGESMKRFTASNQSLQQTFDTAVTSAIAKESSASNAAERRRYAALHLCNP